MTSRHRVTRRAAAAIIAGAATIALPLAAASGVASAQPDDFVPQPGGGAGAPGSGLGVQPGAGFGQPGAGFFPPGDGGPVLESEPVA